VHQLPIRNSSPSPRQEKVKLSKKMAVLDLELSEICRLPHPCRAQSVMSIETLKRNCRTIVFRCGRLQPSESFALGWN
jgi:hypothetical protein